MCADKIYRNRKNLAWCKERGIAVSGPKLGRPTSDAALSREQKEQEHRDICERNAVEGVFGTAKTAYGMDPVMTRLEGTTETVIALALMVFNLKKFLRASLCLLAEAALWVSRWLYEACAGARQRLVSMAG